MKAWLACVYPHVCLSLCVSTSLCVSICVCCFDVQRLCDQGYRLIEREAEELLELLMIPTTGLILTQHTSQWTLITVFLEGEKGERGEGGEGGMKDGEK